MVLRELAADDSYAGFSLGHADFTPLKTYLRRHAKRDGEALFSKTYVFAADRKVVAYTTLVCGQIESAENEQAIELAGPDYRYNH